MENSNQTRSRSNGVVLDANKSINPKMLLLARESRGLSQVELCTRTQLNQGTISKIENGQLLATDDIIKKYADSLEYPISFFYQDIPNHNLPVTFYRKRVNIPAYQLKSMQARLTILCERLHKLTRSVDIPELRVPFVDADDYRGDIAAIARDIRTKWNIPNGPINNLIEIIEQSGVMVIDCDFGTNKVDGISLYDHTGRVPPVILLNQNSPGDRQRHTIAHEFAHLVLHHHKPLPPIDCEPEADLFASEFLVPSKDIKPYLGDIRFDNLLQLKMYWKVSMASLLVRSERLGKVTPRHYRTLWMQFSKHGWRTNEPGIVARETPRMLKEVLEFHVQDLNYNEDSLCTMLDCLKGDFYKEFPRVYTGLRMVR